jgi:hypothetical protein
LVCGGKFLVGGALANRPECAKSVVGPVAEGWLVRINLEKNEVVY